MKMLLYCIRK